MVSEELLQSFIAEASDLLDDVEPSLVGYSRVDDEGERMELVNRVFRHLHSIKGGAGFVDLRDIARLTHEAEALLEQFRKTPERIIPQEAIDLLCRTVDRLRAILQNGGETREAEEGEQGIDSLVAEIVAATRAEKKISASAGPKGGTLFHLAARHPAAGEREAPPEGPDATQVVDREESERLAVPPESGAPEAKAASSSSSPSPSSSTAARTSSSTRRRSSDPSETARIISSGAMARHDKKLDANEFAARYASEANELLEQIEQSLLQAEQHPESGGDAIQEALRCLHSFKGNSGFMNLHDLERLGHRMEAEVESTIGRTLGLDSQTFDALLQMIDVLRQGVLDFSCGGSGRIPEADAYIAMMDKFSKERPPTGFRRPDTAIRSAPPSRDTGIYRRAPAPARGAGRGAEPGADGTQEPEKKKSDTAVLPSPFSAGTQGAEGGRGGEAGIGFSTGQPEKGAAMPSGKSSTQFIDRPPGGRSHDTTRLVLRGDTATQEDLRSLPRTDNIVINTADPVPSSQEKAGKGSDGTSRSTDTTRLAKISDTTQKRRAEQLAARNDIRVDLRKLDGMLDLVGELVIAEAMVTRHPVVWNAENESLERAVHQLRRVAGSLQDMATSVRMIPLAPTFRRMTRLVYDLSGKAGKKVDLALLGEDTEVDRTVIERISDPLVHIVRNAIDHGIEPPEERIRLGKPETGSLTIEGHHEGGEVWIVITDDGRGLDRDLILRRAIARGLVQGDGADLPDSQVYHFIFEPGFSTTQTVTDISGRGFGMDVVKKNIEKLSGRIDIRTRSGEGMSVIMRIPLTLAIIDGMLVSSGDTRYIIPLLSIRESLRPREEQIMSTPDGQEMVKIREELIPIVKLNEIFNRVKSSHSLTDGILMIVEGDDGEVVALFADELLGQQETVIKGLSGWLKKSRGVSGCTILGDGEVGLILDVGAIVRLAGKRSA